MLLSWTDAEGIRPPPSWGWVRHRPRLRQCRWRRSFPIKGVVPACLSTGSLPPLQRSGHGAGDLELGISKFIVHIVLTFWGRAA